MAIDALATAGLLKEDSARYYSASYTRRKLIRVPEQRHAAADRGTEGRFGATVGRP
jgi:hypothetical protein